MDDRAKKFLFKQGLYLISNKLTTSDVAKIKFMLSDFLPRQQLEKTRSGFDLLCLMSTRCELLSPDNYSFLEEVLQEVGKSDCVRSSFSLGSSVSLFIHNPQPLPQKLPHEQPKLLEIKKFLGEMSDNLSTDNVYDLCLFFSEICESINYQKVGQISAEQLFSKLQESHILGIGQLQPLRQVLVLLGRCDLASCIDDFNSGVWQCNSLSTPEEEKNVGILSSVNMTCSTLSVSETDSTLSTSKLLSKIVEQEIMLEEYQAKVENMSSELEAKKHFENQRKQVQLLRTDLKKKIEEMDFLQLQLTKLQDLLWKKDDVPLYSMSQQPHGMAIVFINEKFDPTLNITLHSRMGAEKDAACFLQTFEFLNYVVKVHYNLTADEIRSVMSEVSTLDHSLYDSFICCVSSHGNQLGVYGSDGKLIHRISFIDLVKSCGSLLNKPKLFFFQACRVAPDYSELCSLEPSKSFLDHDILIVNASTEGNPAYTSPLNGSWFANAIKQKLTDPHLVYVRTLQQLLEEVTDLVSRNEGSLRGGEKVKQCVEVTTRMRKGVKFFKN